MDGGSQEEQEKAMASNDRVWGGRLAAARTWKKYKHAGHLQAMAERELQKVGPHDNWSSRRGLLRTIFLL